MRDRRSRELLEALPGGPPVVELAPDPVYALELGYEEPPPAIRRLAAGWGLLTVNVRPWAEAEGLAERAAQAVAAVARRHRLAVVALPMQGARHSTRERSTRSSPCCRATCPGSCSPCTADPALLAAVLRTSAAALTMRLHAALLAHRVGTPCAGLAYDPKIAAHFEEVGRLDQRPPSARRSCRGDRTGARDRPGAPRRRPPALARLESDARAGLDRLADRLAALPAAEARLPEAVQSAPSSS